MSEMPYQFEDTSPAISTHIVVLKSKKINKYKT